MFRTSQMGANQFTGFGKGKALILFFILFSIAFACDEGVGISDDPYAGGKEAFGISFKSTLPTPSSGQTGIDVVFRVTGLLNWCDPKNNRYDFDVYMNGEKVQVIRAVTDSTITVQVPDNLSSGISWIELYGQVFFGPRFTVEGYISIDSYFSVNEDDYFLGGSSVFDYLALDDGNLLLIGDLASRVTSGSSYNYCYGISMITSNGTVIASGSSNFDPERGAYSASLGENPVMSISRFSDGSLLISGAFDRYGSLTNLIPGNVAVLSSKASLRTKQVELVNDETGLPEFVAKTAYNGGTGESSGTDIVLKSFVTPDDRVLLVGNMEQYYTWDYTNSTQEILVQIPHPVHTVCRTDSAGVFDESYRSGAGFSGANGAVTDAFMDEEGGVILVGEFTAFDGNPANSIVRIDPDGHFDPAFQSNVGTGANGNISIIRVNEMYEKAMIVGNFTQYHGVECKGVAMINLDGSLDPSFSLQEMSGGYPNFACLLNSQRVVVAGSFQKYAGVTRNGFLLLDPSGGVEQDFNVPGTFSGQIYQIRETTSADGKYALLIMGSIERFDDQYVDHIFRVTISE